MVLATDDPGILKTDLTSQFVEVAHLYSDITFDEFLTMSRNSLEYSFLPGKSLWQHLSTGKPDYSKRVEKCEQLDSAACKTYATSNLKAEKQVDHENRLTDFIAKYSGNNIQYKSETDYQLSPRSVDVGGRWITELF